MHFIEQSDSYEDAEFKTCEYSIANQKMWLKEKSQHQENKLYWGT